MHEQSTLPFCTWDTLLRTSLVNQTVFRADEVGGGGGGGGREREKRSGQTRQDCEIQWKVIKYKRQTTIIVMGGVVRVHSSGASVSERGRHKILH